MDGLAALGFWLFLGIFLAGGAIAGAIKELGKEREKQATIRALLSADGKAMPEVLEYLREKDAAEAARAHAQWVAMGGDMSARSTAALLTACAVGILTFLGGIFSFGHLSRSTSDFLPIGVMLGIWAVGLPIAGLVWYFGRDRKNDAQRGA